MGKKDKKIAVYFDEKWHLPIEEVKRILYESKDLDEFEMKVDSLLRFQVENLSDLNKSLMRALDYKSKKDKE